MKTTVKNPLGASTPHALQRVARAPDLPGRDRPERDLLLGSHALLQAPAAHHPQDINAAGGGQAVLEGADHRQRRKHVAARPAARDDQTQTAGPDRNRHCSYGVSFRRGGSVGASLSHRDQPATGSNPMVP